MLEAMQASSDCAPAFAALAYFGLPIRGALGVWPAAKEEIQCLFAVMDHMNPVGQLVLSQRNQGQLHIVGVVFHQEKFHFLVAHIAMCCCSACAASDRPATVK